ALGRQKLRARFRAWGAPLALLAGVRVSRKGFSPEFDLVLATSMPRGAPRLCLQPETWGDSILNALYLHRGQREIDHDRMGGLFTIHAECDAGTRLLTAEVRAALIEVARCDVPTLRVEDGVATLRWSFEPEPGFDAALRALAALRCAPIEVELLRDPRRA